MYLHKIINPNYKKKMYVPTDQRLQIMKTGHICGHRSSCHSWDSLKKAIQSCDPMNQ